MEGAIAGILGFVERALDGYAVADLEAVDAFTDGFDYACERGPEDCWVGEVEYSVSFIEEYRFSGYISLNSSAPALDRDKREI